MAPNRRGRRRDRPAPGVTMNTAAVQGAPIQCANDFIPYLLPHMFPIFNRLKRTINSAPYPEAINTSLAQLAFLWEESQLKVITEVIFDEFVDSYIVGLEAHLKCQIRM